jgi:pilus assembly protein FimV
VPAAPASSPDDLLELAIQNPTTTGLALGLLGLLAGFGWRRRQQQASSPSNAGKEPWGSTASPSFEKGGGARVDTTEGGATASNATLYQDSQLELAHELDPVAEAEVYLAYGKDVPAEEILKEGLQQDPSRVAIYLKLLGIFAKREDATSFEAMALNVRALVDGRGSDWTQVQEMGRSLWPSNPLYASNAGTFTPVVQQKPAVSNSPAGNGEAKAIHGLSSSDAASRVPSGNEGSVITNVQQSPPDLGSDSHLQSLESAKTGPASLSDRLSATLALAEQFLEIGEKEGARALLEEVIAGEIEPLTERAKMLLTQAA